MDITKKGQRIKVNQCKLLLDFFIFCLLARSKMGKFNKGKQITVFNETKTLKNVASADEHSHDSTFYSKMCFHRG
jgi:hypothetical protein